MPQEPSELARHEYRNLHGVRDDLLIGGTQAVWPSGSEAAHAPYHFVVMRFDQKENVHEESGGSIVRLRGNLNNDVGPALAAATITLNEAFQLYNVRRASHNRT